MPYVAHGKRGQHEKAKPEDVETRRPRRRWLLPPPLRLSLSPPSPASAPAELLPRCLAALATKDSIKKVSKGKMRIIKTNQHVVFVPCQKPSRGSPTEPSPAESSRRSRSQPGTKCVCVCVWQDKPNTFEPSTDLSEGISSSSGSSSSRSRSSTARDADAVVDLRSGSPRSRLLLVSRSVPQAPLAVSLSRLLSISSSRTALPDCLQQPEPLILSEICLQLQNEAACSS